MGIDHWKANFAYYLRGDCCLLNFIVLNFELFNSRSEYAKLVKREDPKDISVQGLLDIGRFKGDN